jgi:hypothetical protein
MIGLVYVLVLGGHLLLSIWLVKIAIKFARKAGKPGWHYGLPVGLFMFSLLYWDLIPTLAIHRCYCLTEGGFTVYKTLDEWKHEYPGIADTLIPYNNPSPIRQKSQRRYMLNQRFDWEINTTKELFGIRKKDERIVDSLTGEILAKYIDFDTDIRAIALGPRNFRDYKAWLKVDSCESSGHKSHRKEFSAFKHLIKYQKEIEP